MDATAECGRNPVSKHQIQPEYGDEQADAGRDCRTRVARLNSQAPTLTGKYSFSVQLTTSRIGNLTQLIHNLAICMAINTYINYLRSPKFPSEQKYMAVDSYAWKMWRYVQQRSLRWNCLYQNFMLRKKRLYSRLSSTDQPSLVL